MYTKINDLYTKLQELQHTLNYLGFANDLFHCGDPDFSDKTIEIDKVKTEYFDLKKVIIEEEKSILSDYSTIVPFLVNKKSGEYFDFFEIFSYLPPYFPNESNGKLDAIGKEICFLIHYDELKEDVMLNIIEEIKDSVSVYIEHLEDDGDHEENIIKNTQPYTPTHNWWHD